jgi:hypothetical protein
MFEIQYHRAYLNFGNLHGHFARNPTKIYSNISRVRDKMASLIIGHPIMSSHRVNCCGGMLHLIVLIWEEIWLKTTTSKSWYFSWLLGDI